MTFREGKGTFQEHIVKGQELTIESRFSGPQYTLFLSLSFFFRAASRHMEDPRLGV